MFLFSLVGIIVIIGTVVSIPTELTVSTWLSQGNYVLRSPRSSAHLLFNYNNLYTIVNGQTVQTDQSLPSIVMWITIEGSGALSFMGGNGNIYWRINPPCTLSNPTVRLSDMGELEWYSSGVFACRRPPPVGVRICHSVFFNGNEDTKTYYKSSERYCVLGNDQGTAGVIYEPNGGLTVYRGGSSSGTYTPLDKAMPNIIGSFTVKYSGEMKKFGDNGRQYWTIHPPCNIGSYANDIAKIRINSQGELEYFVQEVFKCKRTASDDDDEELDGAEDPEEYGAEEGDEELDGPEYPEEYEAEEGDEELDGPEYPEEYGAEEGDDE